MIALIVIFLMIRYSYCNYVLNGKFKECLIQSHQNRLKIEKCPEIEDQWFSHNPKLVNRVEGQAFVFSKHQFVLEGLGQECSMKARKFKLTTDIFMNKYTEHIEEIVKLTRYDCLNMISNQLCNGRKMSCKSKEECIHLEERNPEVDVHPWWLGTHSFILFECKYSSRLLIADSFERNIIHSSISSCQANDLYCDLGKSIVIWDRDIIRVCPFERILYIKDLLSYNDSNNKILFYYSRNQSLLFTPTSHGSIYKECGGNNFIQTTEGLYLSIVEDEKTRKGLLSLPESKVKLMHLQENDLRNILMSQEDYAVFKLLKMNLVFACSAFLNNLRSNLNHDDTFVVINEMGYADDLIVYFDDGVSYLPVCTDVHNITIFRQQKIKDECYEDVQIIYKNQKLKNYKRGFLRKNGIITLFSKRIPCELSDYNAKSIFVDDILVQKKSNEITLINFNESVKTVLRPSLWNTNELHRLFEHHSLLTNGSNIFESIEDLFHQHVKDVEHTSDILNGIPVGRIDGNDDDLGFVGSMVKSFKGFFSSIWQTSLEFLIYLVISFLVICVFYFTIKCIFLRLGGFNF